MYVFNGFYVREQMLIPLKEYVTKGIPVGDFLRRVISNDLAGAIAHADDESIGNLPAFVGYLYNEAPAGCWGSIEAYKNWVETHRTKKENKQ